MPSFPKTSEGQAKRAVYLAERREQYRRAVQSGIAPRQAGHIYKAKEFDTKLQQLLSQTLPKSVTVKPPSERQKESGISRSAYAFHSYYQTYVKVHVIYELGGVKKSTFITVAYRNTTNPTRAQLLERVQNTLRGTDSEPINLLGIFYGELQQVPVNTYSDSERELRRQQGLLELAEQRRRLGQA